MTTITSYCERMGCIHYNRYYQTVAGIVHTCKAFQTGIPIEIVTGKDKHTSAVEGDGGFRFERDPGAPDPTKKDKPDKPSDKAYDPDQPRNPKGHPDAGKWRDDTALAQTIDNSHIKFSDESGVTTDRMMAQAGDLVASKMTDVTREDILEVAKEEKWPESSQDKTLDELKGIFARGTIREWAAMSGEPVHVAAIAAVAGKLGLSYDSLDKHSAATTKYIREHVGMQKAVESLGNAIYDTTQQWFKDRGITEVTLVRGGGYSPHRLYQSWSFNWSGIRHGNNGVAVETFPVKRIFSIPPTGFGVKMESEAVVLPEFDTDKTDKAYDPSQPRNPVGHPDAGKWRDTGKTEDDLDITSGAFTGVEPLVGDVGWEGFLPAYEKDMVLTKEAIVNAIDRLSIVGIDASNIRYNVINDPSVTWLGAAPTDMNGQNKTYRSVRLNAAHYREFRKIYAEDAKDAEVRAQDGVKFNNLPMFSQLSLSDSVIHEIAHGMMPRGELATKFFNAYYKAKDLDLGSDFVSMYAQEGANEAWAETFTGAMNGVPLPNNGMTEAVLEYLGGMRD